MDTTDNNRTDATNNEISTSDGINKASFSICTIVDEIIQQNTENNNIINLDDDNMINYIYATVFDKIDDIIKENPNIEHVLKNNKQVIAMINNNIPKKLAYTTSFSQTILLILVMYNNTLKKNNKNKNSNDSEGDYDIPDIAVD